MISRIWTVGLLAGLALAGLSACATKPPASDPAALAAYEQTNDPLEPLNRKLYAVNDTLDTYFLKPIAQGYAAVVPHVVRNHIGDVLANLHTPVIFMNDILEAKSRRAGDSLVRFVVNSTVGLGGIFDVASGLGYPAHEADFGITLAIWGVKPGPFLYLPVLGPSDPRDAAGYGVGVVSDPFFWIGQGAVVTALDDSKTAVGIVNLRAELLKPIDEVKRMALDPYATFRSLYRQHREAAIQAVRDDHRSTPPDWYPRRPATGQ
ncbi:MAG: VacJ family lipoprotein [Proteobacteria bacterium]|nr:VacJ family lipoprotein [Pseudomonadota bacterium]